MSAPTADEVATVDAGINEPLARAEGEMRHEDPALAELQDARDNAAVRGHWAEAEHLERALRCLELDEDEQEAGG